jgi:protocatechuate 3,4-dioxygenase beta subunit
MTSLTGKKTIASLALLAALIGAGTAVRQPEAGAAESPAAQTEQTEPGGKPAAADPKPGPVTVRGRVLGHDGKPLAGARLVYPVGGKAAEVGTTGPDGQFAVALPDRKGVLIARADGVGVDLVTLSQVDAAAEVELRAVPDRVIRGRVVDTQGGPVRGAKVTVERLTTYANNTVDGFLAEWKTRHFMGGLPGGVKSLWAAAGLFPAVTTGADGRFAVAGLGAERFVTLRVRGPGIADTDTHVVTRDGFDPKPYNRATLDNVPKGMEGFVPLWLLDGPDPVVVAEAEKPVRGVLRDADTGEPRAGVRVSLTRSGRELLPIAVSAVTGPDGAYQLRGARKLPGGYTIEIPADPATGHVASQAEAADTPGYEPLTIDVRVKKGVVITGRVIDAATKEPLPGFAMAGVLQDNPFVKEYPAYSGSASFAMSETAADGTFRVVTLPGPVILMGGPLAWKMPDPMSAQFRYKPVEPDPAHPKYFLNKPGIKAYYLPGGAMTPLQGNYAKVLELKPGAGTVTHDVVVERAAVLKVSVVGPDGKPLAGVWVAGQSPEDWHHARRVAGDSFDVYHLNGRPRLVAVTLPDRKLAGVLRLKGTETEPVTVTLGPAGSVAGRLVGEDGKPLAGVPVSGWHQERTAQEARQGKPAETDSDGRFRLDGIVPGVPFNLTFGRGRNEFGAVGKLKAVTAEAGKTADAGEVKVRPKPDSEE